ncbi:TetR/AcrR family transcriptional regulator [Salinactinospora qingdaonensis]|uniref:TetR family transcriptional regulator n=1 Tax=Salinactinospora qingdaonensis TaxID=702744 RepID=A0ABP7GFY2_9ACTN
MTAIGEAMTGNDSSGGRSAGPSTAEVVAAAVRLFTSHGYAATTMGDIAVDIGVSRRTLFRNYGSKEDLLFAEHEDVFETVQRYLSTSANTDRVAAVCEAARMVFASFVRAPEIAVPRYHLVRALPALRDREIAMTARYQRAFSRHLAAGETDETRLLICASCAASLIAAHNHVLRAWLRAPSGPLPWERFDTALEVVTEGIRDRLRVGGAAGSTQGGGRPTGEGEPDEDAVLVAVYPTRMEGAEVMRRVRQALQ